MLKKFCRRVGEETLKNVFSSHGKFPLFPQVKTIHQFPAELLHEKIILAGQLSAILCAREIVLASSNSDNLNSDALDLVTRSYPTEVIGAGECGALSAKATIVALKSEEILGDDGFKIFDKKISDETAQRFCQMHKVKTPKVSLAHRFVGLLHESEPDQVMIIDPFFEFAATRREFFTEKNLIKFYTKYFEDSSIAADFLQFVQESLEPKLIAANAFDIQNAEAALRDATKSGVRVVATDPNDSTKTKSDAEVFSMVRNVVEDFEARNLQENELREIFSWVNRLSSDCYKKGASFHAVANKASESPSKTFMPEVHLKKVANTSYLYS